MGTKNKILNRRQKFPFKAMKLHTVIYSQPRSNVEVRDQHHAQVALPLEKEP
jgi:hypothetical protein